MLPRYIFNFAPLLPSRRADIRTFPPQWLRTWGSQVNLKEMRISTKPNALRDAALRLLRTLSAAGLAGGTVTHRSESSRPGALNHSRHIGNATVARKLCKSLVKISRVTSYRSQTKTPDPFFILRHNQFGITSMEGPLKEHVVQLQTRKDSPSLVLFSSLSRRSTNALIDTVIERYTSEGGYAVPRKSWRSNLPSLRT